MKTVSDKETCTEVCRFCHGHFANTDTCLYIAHLKVAELEAEIQHRKEVWTELVQEKRALEDRLQEAEAVISKINGTSIRAFYAATDYILIYELRGKPSV